MINQTLGQTAAKRWHYVNSTFGQNVDFGENEDFGENPWISTKTNIFMDFHGFPWISLDFGRNP